MITVFNCVKGCCNKPSSCPQGIGQEAIGLNQSKHDLKIKKGILQDTGNLSFLIFKAYLLKNYVKYINVVRTKFTNQHVLQHKWITDTLWRTTIFVYVEMRAKPPKR